MGVLLTGFAIMGLAVCALGLAIGLAVAGAGALQSARGGGRLGVEGRRTPALGGIGFGLSICLWWVPAACASIGLLQRDAAVVSASLALWIAGAPLVLGAGSLVRRSSGEP